MFLLSREEQSSLQLPEEEDVEQHPLQLLPLEDEQEQELDPLSQLHDEPVDDPLPQLHDDEPVDDPLPHALQDDEPEVEVDELLLRWLWWRHPHEDDELDDDRQPRLHVELELLDPQQLLLDELELPPQPPPHEEEQSMQ